MDLRYSFCWGITTRQYLSLFRSTIPNRSQFVEFLLVFHLQHHVNFIEFPHNPHSVFISFCLYGVVFVELFTLLDNCGCSCFSPFFSFLVTNNFMLLAVDQLYRDIFKHFTYKLCEFFSFFSKINWVNLKLLFGEKLIPLHLLQL